MKNNSLTGKTRKKEGAKDDWNPKDMTLNSIVMIN